MRPARVCLALSAASLVLLGGLAEMLYRFQLVDFYQPELKAYNSPQDSAAGKRTVLVLGDSFSAGSGTYVSKLRRLLPHCRVINGGISGTGVVQAALVAPRRVREFRPSLLMYQVYVGNDLFDLRYPVNWEAISPVRNVYWSVASRFLFLNFVNYRLAQMSYGRASVKSTLARAMDMDAPFSPSAYTQRPVINLRAEPGLIEDSVLAAGERSSDCLDYCALLRRMLEQSPCRARVLVIPHCSQVHTRYMSNFLALGARFNHREATQQADYPFINRIRQAVADLPAVAVLNALPVLRAAEEQGTELYYRNDEHLNARGHEVVAGFVAHALSGRLDTAQNSPEAGDGSALVR